MKKLAGPNLNVKKGRTGKAQKKTSSNHQNTVIPAGYLVLMTGL